MSSKDFKAVDVLPEMKNYMNEIKIKHIPTDAKRKRKTQLSLQRGSETIYSEATYE